MRCLHCGSTLSAFKKFTDGDFCSAEHRDAFYSEQQRLILERLKQSGERFRRLRSTGRPGDPSRVAVPPPVAPVEAQPPAPVAAFLLSKLDPHSRAFRLASLEAIASENDPLSKPRLLASSCTSAGSQFSSLLPDLPWPRYNPGLQWYAEWMLAAEGVAGRLPGLGDLGYLPALAFPTPGPLQPRRPDVANRAAAAVRYTLRLARPKGQISLRRVRLEVTRAPLGVGTFGFQAFGSVGSAAPPALTPFFHATPVEVAVANGIPASLRLRAVIAGKGMSFLDRIYRMRPRVGVNSSDVSIMRALQADPLPARLGTTRPTADLSRIPAFAPPQVSRFVRSRPKGPVSGDTPALLSSQDIALLAVNVGTATSPVRATSAASVQFAQGSLKSQAVAAAVSFQTASASSLDPGTPVWTASPAVPASAPMPSPEPTQLERLYRARMRPVAAPTASFTLEQPAMEASSVAGPWYPSTGLEFGLAPRSVERFFPPRPRGPADSKLPLTKTEPTQSELPAAVAHKPLSSLGPWAACEPAAVSRFFRPRPRGPVPAQLSEVQVLGAEPQVAPTQIGFVSLVAPALVFDVPPVTTLFRARPRSGVPSGSMANLGSSAAAESLQSRPVTPAIELLPGPVPAPVTRMFRMRPRAGVDGATPAIQVPALEAFAPRTLSAANPAAVVPALRAEVVFLDRLYRGRPRNGVPSLTRAYSPAGSGEAAAMPSMAVVRPSYPAAMPRLEPLGSDRILRSRPRTGVLDPRLASSLESSAVVEALLSIPAKPAIGLMGCEPSFVDRILRMRPRSGVGLDTAASYDQIPVVSESSPVAPTIAEFTVAEPERLSPRLVDRMYRGRPRAGVLSAELASFGRIEPTNLPFEIQPAAVCQTLPECAPPSVMRLVRFRPKTGVNAFTPLATSGAEFVAFAVPAPEFMPDWWDVLHGAKPMFMNKMYRMRLKNPAQDEDTVTRAIRTKHIPIAEPEPILATLPAPGSSAAPSFLDRLYRMRPKGGKSTSPAANAIPCDALEPRLVSGAPNSVLQSVSKQWKATPLRIKSLAATVPVLLLIALFPWGTTPTVAAENPLRQAMSRRAAIEQTANFVDRLSQWRGAGRWKLTPSGAIQPVGLGLFEPSLNMRDYRLTFRTQVHKGGVGFVVRATDERNYQAIKLKVVKSGPLPVVRIVRWAVVDGEKTSQKDIPLPVNVSADTQYRIAVDVNRESFTLMIQEQVVDFWSEERLKSGGAGFFGDKGERASIHSVHMTHQDDAIGKLFAALTLR